MESLHWGKKERENGGKNKIKEENAFSEAYGGFGFWRGLYKTNEEGALAQF